ncbi:MAG: hypothetical protein JO089_07575, partial [Alphaproteobacteria bacterium]|nr:hypothetical protein [Alphaproteobacteria bacterium]
GPTRSNIGMAWGWYALSPSWRGIIAPGLNAPGDYHLKSLNKVAVLLTQGSNFNPGVDDPTFAQICSNMKADGIRIFTVAFEPANGNVTSLLQNCASPGDYYGAPDAQALSDAFSSIGTSIAKVRLTH